MRFLQQHSQPGCRFIKRLSDLPRLALCETGTVQGGEADPLALTPLTRRVLPCVCLPHHPLSHLLTPPAPLCMHAHSKLLSPFTGPARGHCCEAFSRVLLLCSLSPRFPALRSVGPALGLFACLPSHCSFCLKPLIKIGFPRWH